jgi:hypothetical protein
MNRREFFRILILPIAATAVVGMNLWERDPHIVATDVHGKTVGRSERLPDELIAWLKNPTVGRREAQINVGPGIKAHVKKFELRNVDFLSSGMSREHLVGDIHLELKDTIQGIWRWDAKQVGFGGTLQ